MKFTDQPGRLFAIFILAPYLIYKGYKIKDIMLKIIGIIFIMYECYWISTKCYLVCD